MGSILYVALGNVEELEHLRRKERLCFSWVQCWLLASHLRRRVTGLGLGVTGLGLGVNPPQSFSHFFLPDLSPAVYRELMDFPLLIFSGGEITKQYLLLYQLAGSRHKELWGIGGYSGINSKGWHDLMVQQSKSKIWQIIYKSVINILWKAKTNLF